MTTSCSVRTRDLRRRALVRGGTLLVLAVLALGALLLLSRAAAAGTIRFVGQADPTCAGRDPCYGTIAFALHDAAPGDTIRVGSGTYRETVAVGRKHQLTLEADPAAPAGSVVLSGASRACGKGDALRISASDDVTVRGFTITGAGGQALDLAGGRRSNRHVVIERNRIFGNGTRACQGGIRVGPGNTDAVVLNNLIYANGREALKLYGGTGGPHWLVQNVIHHNRWVGLAVTKGQTVTLINNLITDNGTDAQRLKELYGVRRPAPARKPAAEKARLLSNLICGNTSGELFGGVLDGQDEGNLTPTGTEGPGVRASPGCGTPATVYANVDGADGLADTADDDFRLAPGSPAADSGTDPRARGVPVSSDQLEADFLHAAARPRRGRFDIGAFEDPTGEPCYEGPAGTEGVALCHGGTRDSDGQCMGQVLPAAESCNGQDDDCDGQVDEDCWVPLITRSWTVEPMTFDKFECRRIRVDSDLYITGFRPVTAPGHDTTIVTRSDQAPVIGDYDCTGGNLDIRMIYASAIGTGEFVFPSGVGVHVRAGEYLNLNMLLANPGATELSGVAGVLARLGSPAQVTAEADMTFAGTLDIDIPSDGQPHIATGGCAAPADSQIAALWPHLHAAGRHQRVALNGATILDTEFAVDAQRVYPLALTLHPGDQIIVTCTYVNNSGHVLKYGDSTTDEQCFTGMYRSPAPATGTLYDCVTFP